MVMAIGIGLVLLSVLWQPLLIGIMQISIILTELDLGVNLNLIMDSLMIYIVTPFVMSWTVFMTNFWFIMTLIGAYVAIRQPTWFLGIPETRPTPPTR